MEEEKNIPAEQAGIPPEQPAENIPEETAMPDTETSEIINPQSDIENMEVHHHTHAAHGKKNWKSYFWEFLMLFLALTLGFFVENQREHYIEHIRAKKYAHMLIDDLTFDIAELNRAERVLNKIITAGDSLAGLLSGSNIKKIPGGKLYYYEYWSGWRWSIISRDATLQQLKNSGSLRYFGDTSLIRKILSYEESIRVIYMLQNKYEPEKSQNWSLAQRVFDQGYFNILDTIAPRDSTTRHFELNDKNLIHFLNSDYPLYTYEKNVLQELRNWAYNSSRNYKVIVNDIRSVKEKAYLVIEALKKEYHLK